MNDIMQLLILIILGLLGITKFQSHKAKDLKKDIQKAQDTAIRKEKELEKIHEVQQKITAIEQEAPPEKNEPPESGNVAGRLDRLNRLHERANGRGE